MKRALPSLALLLACACAGKDPDVDPCNPYGSPVDDVLCERFEAHDYQPIAASEQELCTRLWIDLLGVRPTADDLESQCYGRDPYDVVAGLQARPEYREAQRRRWADVLQYNDYWADVAHIKDLDSMVDALYRGQLSYGDFGEAALTHPAFVGRHIGYGEPQKVAEAAFQAFLGRRATTPEAQDVGNLWRLFWPEAVFEDGPAGEADGAGEDVPPPAGGYYAPPLYVDPRACPVGSGSCTSTTLGEASVEFAANGRVDYIPVWELSAEEWDSVQEAGRLFTRQPMYWEAQVDLVLKRYLGYDFGAEVPEARQALVRWFQVRQDVALLERYVVLSWAYRQTALEDPEQPRPAELADAPWAYGPTKLMIPETWLKSVGQLTGNDPGDCDWRYPNLPDWYYPDPELDAVLDDLHYERTGDTLDPWFRDTAVAMGGCPNTFDYFSFTSRQRSTHMGLMTAVAQEEATVEMCLVRDTPGLLPEDVSSTDTSEAALRATIEHVLAKTTGAAPRESEVDLVLQRAHDGCEGCDAENLARDLCAGLVGATRYIFY